MDRGRINLRSPVGETPVSRLALLGGGHQPPDLGKKRRIVGRRHLHLEGCAEIERSGINLLPRRHRRRIGLAGDQALVDLARPGAHHPVRRDAVTGGNEHPVARGKGVRRHRTMGTVGLDQGGNAGLEADQILRFASGADPQPFIEKAADEQEEQQRHRGVEIDLIAADDGLIEAHARRQENGERDRHVHVEPAATQRPGSRLIEGLPGIDHGRQRDQRRKPGEQTDEAGIHVAGAPGPHRDRQQHDVHGGEAGDGDAPQQIFLAGGIGVGLHGVDRRRSEANPLKRRDQIGLGGAARLHDHAQSLGGEVGTRASDPLDTERRPLDRANAAAAAHIVDSKGEGLRGRLTGGVDLCRALDDKRVDGHGVSGTKRRCFSR